MNGRSFLRLPAAIAVVAALSAGSVQAQQARGGQQMQDQEARGGEQQRRAPRYFRLLDTDGDGKVTAGEIAAEQGRLFGAADVDGDGKLSVAEFRRRGRLFMRLRAVTLFDLMDVDGDQTLTPGEIGAPAGRWLKRHDSNGDGLTADELPRRPGRRGWRRGKRG